MEVLYKLNRLRQQQFQARVCAAVVYKGRIVDVGFNSKKTHTMQKGFNQMKPFLHAETEAMIRASKKLGSLEKCYLVVVRTKKDGVGGKDILGISKPCESCQMAMKKFGINKAYYIDALGMINVFQI